MVTAIHRPRRSKSAAIPAKESDHCRAAAEPCNYDSRPIWVAFTPEFFRDEGKLQQWSAFVRDLSAQIPSFETVISELAAFIAPATIEARVLLQKDVRGLGVLPQRR